MKGSKLSRIVEECDSANIELASGYPRTSRRTHILRRNGKHCIRFRESECVVQSMGRIAVLLLQMIVASFGYAGLLAQPTLWVGIWFWKLDTVV
ncbi:hypothetical protein DL95DRAFT_55343 [Leptodontidium sp. 2 PMI_412]|nr:hypothetical protein DL95DRAFT_55343 [Leptodontidium sp. 2 PMI_412]